MRRFNLKKLTPFLIAGSFVAIHQVSHKITHGFSYLNFKITPPEDYNIDFSNPEASSILKQKFSYLGHGGESLVFSSEDHQWVLKVFKKNRLHHFREIAFLKPLPIMSKFFRKQEKCYSRFWSSLKLQSEVVSDISGLHYVHLPEKNGTKQIITLQDPLGSWQKIDLSDVCFIIQKKGELFRDVYLNQTDVKKRQFMLASLVKMYKALEKRGVRIWDNSISRNIGWIDNQPFIIDTGAVSVKDENDPLWYATKHLKGWISKTDETQTGFVSNIFNEIED